MEKIDGVLGLGGTQKVIASTGNRTRIVCLEDRCTCLYTIDTKI